MHKTRMEETTQTRSCNVSNAARKGTGNETVENGHEIRTQAKKNSQNTHWSVKPTTTPATGYSLQNGRNSDGDKVLIDSGAALSSCSLQFCVSESNARSNTMPCGASVKRCGDGTVWLNREGHGLTSISKQRTYTDRLFWCEISWSRDAKSNYPRKVLTVEPGSETRTVLLEGGLKAKRAVTRGT